MCKKKLKEVVFFLNVQVTKGWFKAFRFFIKVESLQALKSEKRFAESFIDDYYKDTHEQMDLDCSSVRNRAYFQNNVINDDQEEIMMSNIFSQQFSAMNLMDILIRQEKDFYKLFHETSAFERIILTKYAKHFRIIASLACSTKKSNKMETFDILSSEKSKQG